MGKTKVHINPDNVWSRLSDTRRKLEIAVEALKFYADEDHWDSENPLGQTPSCWNDGAVDMGNTARQALLAIQGKQVGE